MPFGWDRLQSDRRDDESAHRFTSEDPRSARGGIRRRVARLVAEHCSTDHHEVTLSRHALIDAPFLCGMSRARLGPCCRSRCSSNGSTGSEGGPWWAGARMSSLAATGGSRPPGRWPAGGVEQPISVPDTVAGVSFSPSPRWRLSWNPGSPSRPRRGVPSSWTGARRALRAFEQAEKLPRQSYPGGRLSMALGQPSAFLDAGLVAFANQLRCTGVSGGVKAHSSRGRASAIAGIDLVAAQEGLGILCVPGTRVFWMWRATTCQPSVVEGRGYSVCLRARAAQAGGAASFPSVPPSPVVLLVLVGHGISVHRSSAGARGSARAGVRGRLKCPETEFPGLSSSFSVPTARLAAARPRASGVAGWAGCPGSPGLSSEAARSIAVRCYVGRHLPSWGHSGRAPRPTLLAASVCARGSGKLVELHRSCDPRPSAGAPAGPRSGHFATRLVRSARVLCVLVVCSPRSGQAPRFPRPPDDA